MMREQNPDCFRQVLRLERLQLLACEEYLPNRMNPAIHASYSLLHVGRILLIGNQTYGFSVTVCNYRIYKLQ